MVIAAGEVHTTGINIESVLAIVIPLAAFFVALAAYLDARQSRRDAKREAILTKIQADTKDEITTAVDHLAEVLLERLETKEEVSKIRTDLAVLNQKMQGLMYASPPKTT